MALPSVVTREELTEARTALLERGQLIIPPFMFDPSGDDGCSDVRAGRPDFAS